MLTLRLTQTTEGQDRYRVEVALKGDSFPLRTASAEFEFKLTDQQQERVRWYLEDYLQYPHDPAPTIAEGIEREMQDIGTRLFNAIFEANKDTRRRWFAVAEQLDSVRLEIASDVVGAGKLPWELLFDPETRTYLVLQAQTFVRTHSTSIRTPQILQVPGPIRILLVICRPSGRQDVPFRSVASRIIKGLSQEARQLFELDVLRPPTFRAKKPCHSVRSCCANPLTRRMMKKRRRCTCTSSSCPTVRQRPLTSPICIGLGSRSRRMPSAIGGYPWVRCQRRL